MPLKTPFIRVQRYRGKDIHIKAPIALPGATLCGLPAIEGTTPKEVTAPVSCPVCLAIVDYCQRHRALRKRAKVKP